MFIPAGIFHDPSRPVPPSNNLRAAAPILWGCLANLHPHFGHFVSHIFRLHVQHPELDSPHLPQQQRLDGLAVFHSRVPQRRPTHSIRALLSSSVRVTGTWRRSDTKAISSFLDSSISSISTSPYAATLTYILTRQDHGKKPEDRK